jgi:hypothetical protein
MQTLTPELEGADYELVLGQTATTMNAKRH